MQFLTAWEQHGKFLDIQLDRYMLNRFRSLKEVPRLTEQMVYKGGKKNPQGSIGPVHNQSLVFTMLPTRKIFLSNIGKWLRGQNELDEGVIEALSTSQHPKTARTIV